MSKETVKGMILTIASSMAFSCGPQNIDVVEQEQGYIKAPDYSKIEQGAFLTTDTSTSAVSFEGPILIWKNDILAKDVAEILKLKDETMELDLEYKREAFKVEYLKGKLAKERSHLEEEIRIAKSKIAENDLDIFYSERSKQLEKEKDWLEALSLGEEGTQEFQTYCQAMIWKFATSDTLKRYKFSVRPSPLGICESYYKDAGYFTGSDCQDPAEGEKKDFYACFWSDTGTLHTDVSYHNGLDLIKSQDLIELKKTIKFQALSNKDLIKFSLLKDGSLTVKFKDQEEVLVSFDDSEIAEFKDFFGDIIRSQFGISRSSEASTQLKELLLDRKNSESSLVYSFNDRVLNLPFAEPINIEDIFLISPEDISILNNLAKGTPQLFGPDLSNALELINVQTNLIATIRPQIDTISNILSGYKDITNENSIGFDLSAKYNAWFNKRGESADTIVEKKMVKALWAYAKINFMKKGPLLSTVFYVDDKVVETRPLQACFDTEQSIQVECGDLKLTSKHAKMKVSMEDPNSGVLNFEISGLEDPQVFLNPTAPTAMPYQEGDFTQEMLLSKTIKFEVLSGLYQNELPVLTGKTFIYDGEQKIYEGTIGLTKAAANL